ncbi:MAG: hypothetical protein RLY43_783, partial [Bacteroidota bacterium]
MPSLLSLGRKAIGNLTNFGLKHKSGLSTLARKTINTVNKGIDVGQKLLPAIQAGVGAMAPELLPNVLALKGGLNQA